jgi:putative chitinase
MTALTMALTMAQFSSLFPRLKGEQLDAYLPALNAALAEFHIGTPQRVAAFLAQVGHESAGLTRWEESFAYTPERLLKIFPNRVRSVAQAKDLVKAGPAAIAEHLYGMRPAMGNMRPGDGWRFRGRGPIQITGRINYATYGDAIKVPLELQPERVLEPAVGFRVAGSYWETHGCNALADEQDVEQITRRINGGLNGFDDRVARWNLASQVLGDTGTRTA